MKYVSATATTLESAKSKMWKKGVVTASHALTRPYDSKKRIFVLAVVSSGDLAALPPEQFQDYFPGVTSPDGSKLFIDPESELWVM
jgi:hypothetical protein